MKLVIALSVLVMSCAPAPRAVEQPRRLGDAMDEVGSRFNRVGRAMVAGRWELATYDLHELKEVFEEDLAGSSWHGKPQLSELAKKFQAQQITALAMAVHSHDREASQRAVADAARACNECHKAADMAYIEISETPGAEVPVVSAP